MSKTRMPAEFAQFAGPLAAANPIAFATRADALKTLRECYVHLAVTEDCDAVATGGFIFRKDGEGDIELWIAPKFAFKTSRAATLEEAAKIVDGRLPLYDSRGQLALKECASSIRGAK